jgi:protein SCO1/2
MNTRRNLLAGIGTAALGWAAWRAAPNLAGKNGDDAFPNTTVFTHEGKQLRFYDDLIRDKIVAINMMYVQCSSVCPLMTANLKRVQQMLGDRVGRDIFMYSITLQPEFDTPQALKAYTELYHIRPGSGWLFLTGAPDDIRHLRTRLGFFDPDPAVDSDTASHTGAVRIGNDRYKRWTMAHAFAEPDQIVATLNHVDQRMINTAYHAAEGTGHKAE